MGEPLCVSMPKASVSGILSGEGGRRASVVVVSGM